jgi:23S rRNA (uracil1939-C5)-methyltransferase
MKPGQTLIVEIEDLTHQGEGIAKVDGFPLFIQGALPGDQVSVKIIQLKKSFGLAEIENIIAPSADRVNPLCDKFGVCGGCQLMALNYPTQLYYKQKRVHDSLRRIGRIDAPVLPIIGMDDPWHYRNKGQFPVGYADGKLSIGFFRQGSHEIINLEKCLIEHPVMETVLHIVREYLETFHISVYNEKTGKGLVRHLIIKAGFETGEVMVILVINGDSVPQQEKLTELLHKGVPGLVSIVLNSNKRNTNVIMGTHNQVLYGKDHLNDRIDDLTFRISPHAFFQVNPIQMKTLYDKTLHYAALSGQETVLDLYCGIGTISLLLARQAKKVIGIESVKAAIEDARVNADMNNINNVEFITGSAEKCLPELVRNGIRPEVIVVDPPRKGCDEAALQAMVQMAPQKIVYVSCNPATLARDLRILEDSGYVTKEIQPVDMFPHTATLSA